MEDILKAKQYGSRFAGKEIPVKIRCLYNKSALWECGLHDGVVIKDGQEYETEVSEALDVCGAFKLRTSFSDEYKDVEIKKWKDWFLDKVTNSLLILDTNFIYRYYCSGILAQILGSDFRSLEFRIPRTVILEIERRGNEIESKKTKISGKKKRLAFYAAREIEFIRENSRNFHLLEMKDRSLMIDFADKAGKGFADMVIRREIHNAWGGNVGGLFFLTCDLMNSMAAEAEGIATCYFSKLSQKKFRVGYYNPKQLFDFILANAVIFGNVQIELLSREQISVESYSLVGVWEGKTISEWYSDSIKIISN